MIRFGLAGAAVLAGALATSLALAESNDNKRGHPGHGPDFAATHTAFCQDLYARATGRLAYLEAKLSLTPQQQPLFAAWRDVVLQTARTRADNCASGNPHDRDEGALAREAQQESRLEARLAALQAEKPSLSALYQSLSDEQKHTFDRAGRHHGRGPGMWGHRREMGGDRDQRPGEHDHEI